MLRRKGAIVVVLVWFFYVIGFTIFGLFGFLTKVSEKGLRAALCGSLGCSNIEFFYSVAWLAGMILIFYILPIAIIIFYVRKRNKGK